MGGAVQTKLDIMVHAPIILPLTNPLTVPRTVSRNPGNGLIAIRVGGVRRNVIYVGVKHQTVRRQLTCSTKLFDSTCHLLLHSFNDTL